MSEISTEKDAPLTDEEHARWDVDPDRWPHTPPYRIFRLLFEEDDNLWWRAGSGHGLNAYEAALEEIDRLRLAQLDNPGPSLCANEGDS